MRTKWPKKETELAAAIVRWLDDQGWDVYQEVPLHGRAADIVAVRGPVLWVIETKLSLGLDVIEQAVRWRGLAHCVSVGVPMSGNHFARSVAESFRLGVIEATDENTVRERVDAPLERRAGVHMLRAALRPEQKTALAAGSQHGERFTPWRETCQRVAREATAKPGIELRELITSIRHHYASNASARACLKDWIAKGKVPGVRLEAEGKLLRVFPASSC